MRRLLWLYCCAFIPDPTTTARTSFADSRLVDRPTYGGGVRPVRVHGSGRLAADGRVAGADVSISRLGAVVFAISYNMGDAVAGISTGILARAAADALRGERDAFAESSSRAPGEGVVQLVAVGLRMMCIADGSRVYNFAPWEEATGFGQGERSSES